MLRGIPRGHARIIRPAVFGGMNGMAEGEADLRVHAGSVPRMRLPECDRAPKPVC
jgi:hypothetical protein